MPLEHPVKIYQEREGCTYENLATLLPRIEALKFKQILVHKKVKALIKDTLYICPEIHAAKFAEDEETRVIIQVPMELSYVQCEYYAPDNPAGKQGVLQFDSISGEIIGHYNHASNSLIICDASHPGGKKAVEALAVFIEATEKFLSLSDTEFKAWLEGWQKEIKWPEFLMGADPEFEIATADGELIAACTVWPASGTRTGKKFGHDGEAHIGEIRPNPKPCPLELTKEIKRLLARILKDPRFPSDGQMWVGGGMKFLTGGHIHISGVDASDDLLDILGIYMAEPMRKSMNIDGGSNRVRDHHSAWTKDGYPERIRGSDDGDPNHWEWRPLMAYHFDEETTNAVHCLFYCIVETYRRNRKILKKERIRQADYKNLEFYEKYKEHVDNFVEKFVKGVQKMEGQDVLDRWFAGRPKEKKITFVCLHQDPRGNRAGGSIFTGIIPTELAVVLEDLRGRPFPNLTKSFRCNVAYYEGSGIRYAGINDDGAKVVEAVVKDNMIGCDYSADILKDYYHSKNWDFSFWLPALSFQTEKNRKALADMIYQAVIVTLKEKGYVT